MIPHERSLVEAMEGRPFVLLGINSDGDKDEYRTKAEEMGVTWRSSWQGSTGGPIPTLWGVTGWPTLYLIDHEGVIRAKGHSLNDTLLEELVEKAEAAAAKTQ